MVRLGFGPRPRRGWLLDEAGQFSAAGLLDPSTRGEACEATACSPEDDPHGVIAFLQIYGGLREDVFPSGGYFSAASNFIAGRNRLGPELTSGLTDSEDWHEASVFFTSGSSSVWLVNNDGKFGWLVAGETQVRMAYDELAGVLDNFIRCHTGLIPRKRWLDVL